MQKKLIRIFIKLSFFAVVIAIVASSINGIGLNPMMLSSGGSKVGYTTSPPDGPGDCSGCHSGGSTVPTVTVTATPAFGAGNTYVPGTNYVVSVNVSGYAKFGFDLEIINGTTASATDAGTFGAVVANARKTSPNASITCTNITQNAPILSSNQAKFNWTAPVSGNAYVWCVGLGVNGNGGTSGDKVKLFTMTLTPSGTISTGTIAGAPFCAGQTGINIPYTKSGTFNAGNVFSAELSNASGSFASPLVIGSVNDTVSGTITSTVPLPNTAGTGYRIRVVSSNPAMSGLDNGTNLTINALPTTANAGSDQSVCTNSTTLNANAPAIGTGQWTLVSGAGTFSSPSSATSGITGLANGANIFEWSISNGSCAASRDTVIVTRIDPPTAADAGVNQLICADSTALSGNNPSIGTGTWSLLSGSGIIATPSDSVTSVTGIGVGNNLFVRTITNGSCSSADTVIITRAGTPTNANAGSDQDVCSASAVLAGNTPSVGTGTWSVVNGTGTFTDANNPSTAVNGLSQGINTFVWTIANPPCNSSSDTVIVNKVASLTVPDAGNDQSVCSDVASLSGNTPSSGTGAWTLISGTGSISDSSISNPSLSGLGIGQNIFGWTISNGVCAPLTDSVIILRVDTPSIAFAGTDQTVCATSAVLGANAPTVGTGVWTVVSGSGSFANSSNPTTTVTGLSAGINSFVWTVSNSPCAASFDTVEINQSGIMTTAAAGADQLICDTVATLSGNTPTFGTGNWSVASGPGTINNPTDPSSAVTGLGLGSNAFVWTITSGSCTPSVDTVIITVSDYPTVANAGADQTVCGANVTLAANTPTTGTGTWTVISGAGTFANPNDPATSVSSVGSGTNTYQWAITSAPCASSSDQVIITQTASISTANAGADQSVCGTTASLAANVPTNGTGAWSVISGSGTIASSSSAGTTVSNLGTGSTIFVWTISNGICNPSSDTVIITSVLNPTTANAGPDQTFCNTSASLSANTPAVGTGTWSVINGSGVFANASSASTTVSGLSNGANTFRWTISNSPCADSFDEVTINNNCNADSIYTSSITGSPFCASTSYSLQVNFTTVGTFTGFYSVQLSDASGSFANPVTIGAGTSSPVYATIPSSTASGTGYRIRVVNSSPSVTGSDNGSDLSVNTCATHTLTTGTISGSPFCSTTTYSVQVPFTSTGSFSGNFEAQLSDASGSFSNPVNIGTGTSSPIMATIPAVTNAGGAYRIRVVSTTPYIVANDNGVDLNINDCMLITTSAIDRDTICANTGYHVDVAFNSSGNMSGPFKAQLSDLVGSFANPVVIGYNSSSPISAEIPSATPAGTGYRIRVVDYGTGTEGANNGSNLAINICPSGIASSGKEVMLQIFPNPNTGSFNLKTNLNGRTQIEISNLLGEVVYYETTDLQSGIVKPVQLKEIAKGVFIVKIKNAEEVYMRKIIVE